MTQQPVLRGPETNGGGRGGVLSAAGDTANRVVASLSNTPALLVLVLMGMVVMAMLGWVWVEQGANNHRERMEMIRALLACSKGGTPP